MWNISGYGATRTTGKSPGVSSKTHGFVATNMAGYCPETSSKTSSFVANNKSLHCSCLSHQKALVFLVATNRDGKCPNVLSKLSTSLTQRLKLALIACLAVVSPKTIIPSTLMYMWSEHNMIDCRTFDMRHMKCRNLNMYMICRNVNANILFWWLGWESPDWTTG